MGSIITAVAVLLTHMLRNAALPMKPATTAAGEGPTAPTTVRAIRLGRPHRSMPAARRKPPRKRKISGLA